MPGNDISENIHNFFEQDNSSQSHQSEGGGGSWPVLNNNPWVGTQRQNGMPLTFSSKNYTSQSLDSEQGNGRQSLQTPFGTNTTRLTLKPEFVRSQPRNQQLNLNGYMHGSHGLQARSIQAEFQGDGTVSESHSLVQRGFATIESQQGNALGYSSGLPRNSERAEVTEAPVNFNFLGGQQQLMRSQHPGISQPRPRQQHGINDMQLWQQHLMYKQLQEMQRQQQLQQLDQGVRQQNSLSQPSGVARQAAGDQLPALLSGTPINNASNYMWSNEVMGGDSKLPGSSHMLLAGNMNLAQRTGSSMQGIPNGLMFSHDQRTGSSMQGIPNGLMFPHDQGQAVRSMGFVPQQPDQSLYGTPITITRGSLSHHSQFHGTSHDVASTEVMNKAGGNQAEKAPMQSSAFNYFQSDQCVDPGQAYLQDAISVAKQDVQGKSRLENAPVQEQLNHFSQSFQVHELQGQQEPTSWSEKLQEKAVGQVGPSCSVANPDPTEEKLLFSADDEGNLNASFVGNSDGSTGGYLHGNPMQSNDYLSAFPSIHSGSWSALMQEAVEASSSDTGLNEEWSGLSFQKAELSSGNHSAVLNGNNGKQHVTWDDSNLQNASSLTSRPLPLFNDADASSNCRTMPSLHQPIKFSNEQNERVPTDAFHESFQRSSKEAKNKTFDQSHQQKQFVGGSLQTQTQFNNVNGVSAGQMYEQPASSAHSADMEFNSQNMQHAWTRQQKVPLHNVNSQPINKLNGWNIESLSPSGGNTSKIYDNDDTKQYAQRNDIKRTMHMERDHDGSMWKVGRNRVDASFPNSAGGPETVKSDIGSPVMRSEDSSVGNLSAVMNSNTSKLNQETDQQVLNRYQVDYGKHAAIDSFLKNKGDKNVAKYQKQLSSSPQAWDSSMNNADRRSGDTYNPRQENSHPKEVPNEGLIFSNLRPGQKTESAGGAGEHSLLAGKDPHPLVGSSLKLSGQSGRKTSGPRRFQFHPMGNLEMSTDPAGSQNHSSYSQGPSQLMVRGLNNQEPEYAVCSQFAGHVSNDAVDMEKRNAKASEEIQSRGTFSSHSAVPSFDGSTSQLSQNKRSGLTSQNMLELLHKVDQSRGGNTVAHFDFSEHNTPSEIPEADVSDGSGYHLQHDQSSALQGFGLKLAPPSQRQFVSDHALPSQTSLETVNDFDRRNLDSGAREKDRTWSLSTNSVQSLPPAHEASRRETMGDKSFIFGQKSKEAMYSNFQGNSLAAAAYTLPMNQSLMQQQQQQQQQQHGSSATGPAPNDQSANLSRVSQVDVDAKQSSHPWKTHESHDGAIADQSAEASLPSGAGRNPPSRQTPAADTCAPVASQFYPANTGHSHSTNASSLRSSGQQTPVVETRSVAQPSAASALSQQGGFSSMLHNVWTSVSSQRRLSGVQPQKIISNVLQSMSPLPSSRETNSQASQKAGDHSKKRGSTPSEFGTCSTNSQQFTYGEDRLVKDNTSQQMPPPERVDVAPKRGSASREQDAEPKHHSDGNSAVSISSLVRLNQQDLSRGKHAQDSSLDTQTGHVSLPSVASSNRDTGSYGHNLESPDVQKRNYSLLQQMQAMKGADSDPTKRAGKRLKGADFGTDTSQMDWAAGQRYIYGQNTVFREMDATSQNSSFPSDVKMLSFSSRENEENSANTSLQIIGREIPSHDLLTHKHHDLQNHTLSSGKNSTLTFSGGSERPQISPQMAPSWFEQYGNYKNGQILTTYDGLGSSQRSTKGAAQQYFFSKVPESMDHNTVPEQRDDASQVGNLRQSTLPTAIPASQSFCSPGLPSEVIDNNLVLIPKKRKSGTSELLPWHKEVTQGGQRLRSISTTELEWARATNRLIEKVEDEFEMTEDALSMTRSRRRLILTTQLMQQILSSVPATFLTADATTSYESVLYFIAKLTLGDACSLMSCSGSDSRVHVDSGNMISGKLYTSEKEGDNLFSKVMEDFIGRSRKLENDFLRLDRRASILDVRLECQDLERCSIINRFAKFHGRAQTEGVESSSTSETAPRQTFPQRHVTALAMPRNLPEGVIYLSL